MRNFFSFSKIDRSNINYWLMIKDDFVNLESEFNKWKTLRIDGNNNEAFKVLDEAKRSLHSSCNKDYEWIKKALLNEERKYFVASIFERTSLPRSLFENMMNAALDEKDVSKNNDFIIPCMQTFGEAKVRWYLYLKLMKVKNDKDYFKITNALYWAHEQIGLIRRGIKGSGAGKFYKKIKN